MARLAYTALLCSLSVLVFASSEVRAAQSEADKLIDQGVDLREQGKDVDALEKFKRAYELSKSARALAQMALAQQALGRWLEAEASLQKALEAKNDKWIKS